jgi:vacuolar protein sorting-associated protein 54
MLADAEYFNSRISKLEGAGDLGEHVVNVVRAKAILSDAKRSSIEKPQEDKAPLAPMASNTETT